MELGGTYIVTAQVLDAADFGVPQTRKRIVLIGVGRELGVIPAPIAETEATSQVRRHRRVQHYRGRVAVPHLLLHEQRVVPVLDQMGHVRVPQTVPRPWRSPARTA